MAPRSAVIATHYYASGPAFELEGFLRPRVERLLFIAHPLFADSGPSYSREYQTGVLRRRSQRNVRLTLVRFLVDVFRTARWVNATGQSFDVFVAGDNLLAIPGIWLRCRGRVQSVVLYSIDFVPRRFRNSIVNAAYHRIDRWAAKHADVVWNVSASIEEARRLRDGDARVAHQITVPVGGHFSRIHRRGIRNAGPKWIVFLGHLTEKQGLQLVIEAMPMILRSAPDARLLIIGGGPHEATLKSLTRRLEIEKVVEFAGFVEDHAEIEERIASCAVAVAPYRPDPSSFTNYADPGKIKTYLACGVPIVMTGVPQIAQRVQAAGAGEVVPYDRDALTSALVDYIASPSKLSKARKAATKLGAEFDWDRIFAEAWGKSTPWIEKS